VCEEDEGPARGGVEGVGGAWEGAVVTGSILSGDDITDVKFGSVALCNIAGVAELIWEVCCEGPRAADRASAREAASTVANVVARELIRLGGNNIWVNSAVCVEAVWFTSGDGEGVAEREEASESSEKTLGLGGSIDQTLMSGEGKSQAGDPRGDEETTDDGGVIKGVVIGLVNGVLRGVASGVMKGDIVDWFSTDSVSWGVRPLVYSGDSRVEAEEIKWTGSKGGWTGLERGATNSAEVKIV
jgi:hypothetical protein